MATKQPQKEKQPVQAAAKTTTAPTGKQTTGMPMIFDKSNYLIMIAGLAFIIVGFLLMAGGGTADKSVFPKEELYSFRRIGLAPIVIMIGFGIEIFAILKRPNVNAQ